MMMYNGIQPIYQIKKLDTIMVIEFITKVALNKIVFFLQSLKNVYTKNIKRIKKFIKAVVWMAKTGAQWRTLPSEYGDWNSVFRRFNEWSKKDIWGLLHQYCITDPDLESVMIDSTVVRAHACAAGYEKGQQETQALGRSSGGFSTKVHTITDALGNPLKFLFSAGQKSDVEYASELIEGMNGSNILGDKGYDSDAFREMINQQNCTPIIPGRSNRIKPIEYDKHTYKERHLVECFIGKIKHFRRVFSRYDKSLRNYASFVCFVGALIWLR
jgi:transposase